MTVAFPTLVISRQPRHIGSGWHDARSWFGGQPQLGRQPWPRDAVRQIPFYFMAQIDLAEVWREIAASGMPWPDGALAFFIGPPADELDCAVVHVPRSELGEPTAPPPDAPAVFVVEGDMFPTSFDDDAPRLFSRWPVDITALDIRPPDVGEDADEDDIREAEDKAQVDAVIRRFIRPPYAFKAYIMYKLLGDSIRKFWWHTAHHYVACLQAGRRHTWVKLSRQSLERARERLEHIRSAGVRVSVARSNEYAAEVKKAEDEVTKCEVRLAEIEQRAAEFERFVSEVVEWVPDTDPWELMPPEAIERLVSTFERGQTAFGKYPRFHEPLDFDDLETETLKVLATADDRAYATMPEALRTKINWQYIMPSTGCGWHQMFGRGVDIQGNAALENEGNVMLLQLVYDDMMHWRFGDIGAFQFWIPPEDLANGNWAAVRLTFEGG